MTPRCVDLADQMRPPAVLVLGWLNNAIDVIMVMSGLEILSNVVAWILPV